MFLSFTDSMKDVPVLIVTCVQELFHPVCVRLDLSPSVRGDHSSVHLTYTPPLETKSFLQHLWDITKFDTAGKKLTKTSINMCPMWVMSSTFAETKAVTVHGYL